MASSSGDGGETLESLLNKATNPMNTEDEWDYILSFCDKVNAEIDGVQTCTKLLVHKMQSPQEREAMQALVVLETCVKNCGENFHKELGKYRFLNELIKLVSPKYLGTQTTKKVQDKVIAMLFTWSVALTEQVKIRDAYQMLKKQGIVTVDPPFNQSLISNPPPPKPDRDTLFTDEEKRKQLDKLLKSSKPEDLQAANRLIKSVVKEDEEKMEKLKKRNKTLEEVNNNVKLLNEMMAHFNPDSPSLAEMQTMKELHDCCQNLRPTLFRLASDTDDDEKALMDILRANDEVSRVMQSFEKIVQPKLTAAVDRKGDGAPEPVKSEPSKEQNSASLLELTGLNLNPVASEPIAKQVNGDSFDVFNLKSEKPEAMRMEGSGFEDNLLTFQSAPVSSPDDVGSLLNDLILPTTIASAPVFKPPTSEIPKLPSPPKPKAPSVFADIDVLSQDLISKSLGGKARSAFPEAAAKPTLNEMSNKVPDEKAAATTAPPTVTDLTSTLDILDFTSQKTPAPASSSESVASSLSQPASANSSAILSLPLANTATAQDFSLNDVFVALESIRPSTVAPLTAYDNNGIRIMIHFAKDHATPTRTDTLVSVVSIMSTRTNPVQNVVFQAAAPKVMKVKLQAPSSTELPAYNPIFSTPPLTQVMIVANPSKKEVKIRYKLDYKIDDQTSISESGLITGFPPVEQWGQL